MACVNRSVVHVCGLGTPFWPWRNMEFTEEALGSASLQNEGRLGDIGSSDK